MRVTHKIWRTLLSPADYPWNRCNGLVCEWGLETEDKEGGIGWYTYFLCETCSNVWNLLLLVVDTFMCQYTNTNMHTRLMNLFCDHFPHDDSKRIYITPLIKMLPSVYLWRYVQHSSSWVTENRWWKECTQKKVRGHNERRKTREERKNIREESRYFLSIEVAHAPTCISRSKCAHACVSACLLARVTIPARVVLTCVASFIRDKPKSQSLTIVLVDRCISRKFSGLISRCTRFSLCRYLMPQDASRRIFKRFERGSVSAPFLR